MSTANEGLDRLLSPVSTDEFFREYWGKKVLHIPRDTPGYYDEILTFHDVNEYLSRTDLRYPYIRMVQNGRELPLDTYGYDYIFGENVFQGNLNTDKIFGLFNSGATMCMQMQQLALPKLTSFTNRLEALLGFKTQTTLFLTPRMSQGFTAHYDSHDFFIFQIHGKKIWNIYDTVEAFPLARTKVLDTEVRLEGSGSHQKVVQPGDLLYVPRGVYHDALTENETSLQVSLGVFPPLWVDVLHSVIDEIADEDEALRKAAPLLGIQKESNARELFDSLLDRLGQKADPESTLKQLKTKAIAKQPPVAKNRLRDYEYLQFIENTTQFIRRDAYTQLTVSNNKVKLAFFDKEIELPGFMEEDARFVCENHQFSATDFPATVDPESRLEFLTLLVEEGLLSIVGDNVHN